MEKNNAIENTVSTQFDKSNLLRPHKMVVNTGEKSILELNNNANYDIYNKLFSEEKKIIKAAVLTNDKYKVKKLPIEGLDSVRSLKGISLIFSSPLEANAVFTLFDIDNGYYIGVKNINEIIIASTDGRLYLVDEKQNAIYELRIDGIQNSLNFIINSLEKMPTISCLFLDKLQPDLISKDVVVPTTLESKGLPVLSGEKELNVKDNIPESIASFFTDDKSSLSIIKNIDGTIEYTDREDQVVKLYTNGMLEYVKYNAQSSGKNTMNVSDAINVSIDFINNHFGFPENSYISDIITSMQGDRFILKFKYSYEGLPIVLDSNLNSDTIEIEVSGNEVKRYKRAVKKISGEMDYKKVLDFIDILDILLDNKVEALSGEKIKQINDMYLAYYERSYQEKISYIPVWVVDVTAESSDKSVVLSQKKRYIINAETGIILDK